MHSTRATAAGAETADDVGIPASAEGAGRSVSIHSAPPLAPRPPRRRPGALDARRAEARGRKPQPRPRSLRPRFARRGPAARAPPRQPRGAGAAGAIRAFPADALRGSWPTSNRVNGHFQELLRSVEPMENSTDTADHPRKRDCYMFRLSIFAMPDVRRIYCPENQSLSW